MRSHDAHARTGIAAGSPVPIELMKSLITRLNLTDLTNAYGMSTFLCLNIERAAHDQLDAGSGDQVLHPITMRHLLMVVLIVLFLFKRPLRTP
jgi:hypothetical protein